MEKFNEIKLDDISFKYKNTENYVFQEFNLTINKFDKIELQDIQDQENQRLLKY